MSAHPYIYVIMNGKLPKLSWEMALAMPYKPGLMLPPAKVLQVWQFHRLTNPVPPPKKTPGSYFWVAWFWVPGGGVLFLGLVLFLGFGRFR